MVLLRKIVGRTRFRRERGGKTGRGEIVSRGLECYSLEGK